MLSGPKIFPTESRFWRDPLRLEKRRSILGFPAAKFPASPPPASSSSSYSSSSSSSAVAVATSLSPCLPGAPRRPVGLPLAGYDAPLRSALICLRQSETCGGGLNTKVGGRRTQFGKWKTPPGEPSGTLPKGLLARSPAALFRLRHLGPWSNGDTHACAAVRRSAPASASKIASAVP
jgi:hypothetical protein